MNIQTPDTKIIEQESLVIVTKAQSIEVVSHDDYMLAGEQLKAIKGAQKKVIEIFREPKTLAHNAHKAITMAEKRLLEPLERAEKLCGQKVQVFLMAEQKRQREEAEKARREAEEAARQAAEAQRKKDEEERLSIAAQLEAQGFKEEANEVISQPAQPLQIVTPIFSAPVVNQPRVEGIHTRTTYKAEVENFLLLVQEVAAGRQPISLLLPNEKVLNDMARALKGELRIAGVRVVEQVGVVTKAA